MVSYSSVQLADNLKLPSIKRFYSKILIGAYPVPRKYIFPEPNFIHASCLHLIAISSEKLSRPSNLN